jgi:hypothetical protein
MAVLGAEMQAAPHILGNGTGDGTLTVGVDGFGSFGSSIGENASDAIYDPVGSIDAAGTVFESGLFISGGPPAWLTSGDIGSTDTFPNPVITGDATNAQSSFTHGFLQFNLVQRLLDSFDENGLRVGTVLEQVYQVRNVAEVPNSFSLTRYVDGDLQFDNTISDGGGVLMVGNNMILFETDAASGSEASTTFVGITAAFSGQIGPNPVTTYEISSYSGLRTKVDQGAPLNNEVASDFDGDRFIDEAYDVTLAIRNHVQIPALTTATYTTRTLFGNAVPPSPGSSEVLPLLPEDNEPPFIFDIDPPDSDEFVWVDPEIAIGYEFEVLAGSFFAGVRMPTNAVVPQSGDYEILVFDGAEFLPAVQLGAGEEYSFGSGGVSRFRVTGIDPSLGLDPTDPLAFPTGLSFVSRVPTSVSMTPLVVPEPSAFLLMLVSLLVLGRGSCHRRRAS